MKMKKRPTLLERKEAFMDAYEKLCRKHGLIVSGDYTAGEYRLSKYRESGYPRWYMDEIRQNEVGNWDA